MTISPEVLANGFLAIILTAFWYGHIVRYKWKLIRRIAALEFKIEETVTGGSIHDTKYYVFQRTMLKNELYELQKLTDYSGFR
jgi:hypothetical protein